MEVLLVIPLPERLFGFGIAFAIEVCKEEILKHSDT